MNSEYEDYLESETWAKKRKKVLEFKGKECEKCFRDFPKHKLHVHHKNYDQEFGKEKDKDLKLVCEECHNELHQDLECFESKNKIKREPKTVAEIYYKHKKIDEGF